MLWIGITGPMGSGKSTVAELVRRLGYAVLDADEVVRQVLSPGSPGESEVLQAFGPEIAGEEGHLDRRALGRIVFADPVQLDRLEKLIHPHVRDRVTAQKEQLAHRGAVAAFYDVPLLFEKKMEDQFDAIIVVSSEASVRLERLMNRTGLSAEEIKERWTRQLPPEYKEARATGVIVNDGNLSHLEERVKACLQRLGVPVPAPLSVRASAKP